MSPAAGEYSLALAVMASAGSALAALAAARLGSAGALRMARYLLAAHIGLVSLAALALLSAFLNDNFTLAYVAGYSERALPTGYKVAAFWAGQEGSLLLWAWVMALMAGLTVFLGRRQGNVEQAVTLAVLSTIGAFFAALLLFASNPFALLPREAVQMDGHGLNPMLQDPGMIAHPPILFLGYAGYAVPFAMMIGALAAGRRDDGWLAPARRWMVAAWLFLSVGILLGAQWAYVELGWGGYWAWDPVENASLLPWLVGTALLHSVVIQQQRGMFRVWNVALIAGAFLLCIFGTFLTRSGVLSAGSSVHVFPDSDLARIFRWFMLAFMAAGVGLTAGLALWRRANLRGDRPLEGLITKEGLFLATNVILLVITAVTLLGTIWPLISGWLGDRPVEVKASFYNQVVGPAALALMALMGVGPALTYGKPLRELGRALLIPAVLAAAGTVAAAALGWTHPAALASTAIILLAAATMAGQLAKACRARMASRGETAGIALLRQIDDNHRRYGGQIVHLAMLMILAGVAGSSLYGQTHEMELAPGQSVQVAGYRLTYQEVSDMEAENFVAAQAHVALTDPNGASTVLHPQLRRYHKWPQLNAEVAISSGLTRDVYLSMLGVDQHGHAGFKLFINPLVAWLWIGGLVLIVGGLWCLLPTLLPRRAAAAAPMPEYGTDTGGDAPAGRTAPSPV